MKTFQVVQGSPEWVALRASGKFCASEAAAMMGEDPKLKRDTLLHMMANGGSKEFSEYVQENILRRGHDVEPFARAKVEEMIGEELYPATIGSDDGRLLASCDGITMSGETGFECKLWNEELAARVRAGNLPPDKYWQLEQQLLIGGMEKIVFAVTDGTDEKFVSMEYKPVRGRAKKLLAGWAQFAEDLANYRAPEVKEPVVADVVMALPTVTITMEGKVALRSNLAVFGDQLNAFLKQINMKPATDQEFANAEAAVKALKEAETKLKQAEAAALAQAEEVDELRRTVAAYVELMATTRITLGKAVEQQKDKIRDDIRVRGETEYAAHISKLNERLGRPYLTTGTVPSNFPAAMKNKKTLDSLNDAVNTELARLKIASNEVADKIAINQKVMNDLAGNHKFLFADVATIIHKEVDDLTALVKLRISEHEAAVKAKAEADARAAAEAEARKAAVAPAPAAAAPTPAAAPATPPTPATTPASTTSARPSPAAMVQALAQAFQVDRTVAVGWLLKLSIAKAYEPGEIIDMGGPDYVVTNDGSVKEQLRLPGVGQ